jgi:hypothetical protein
MQISKNIKTIFLIFLAFQNCIFTRVLIDKDNLNQKKNLIRENFCENIINESNLNIYKNPNKSHNLIFLGIPLDIATTVGLVKFVHPVAGFIYFLFGYVYLGSERFPSFRGFGVFCGSYKKPSIQPFQYYYLERIYKNSEESDRCLIQEGYDKLKMLSEMKYELNIKQDESILDESKYEYGVIKAKSDKCIYYIRIPEYNNSE